MRIYLAGKMDAEYGSWRDAILPSRYDQELKRDVPGWVLLRDEDDPQWGGNDYRCSVPWPRTENRAVLRLHEYVGPYRTDLRGSWEWKHYGEFHGSKVAGQHGASNEDEDGLIVEECRQALARADLCFAYLNRPDCFGTLVEVGFAHARGVYTVLAIEPSAEWDDSDYWFIATMVDAVVGAGRPIDVGTEPVYPPPSGLLPHEAEAQRDAWRAWRDRRDAEGGRIAGLMREAIVRWTARSEKPAPLTLVQQDVTEPYMRALQESASSFSQIARWSADPRVRNEAQRMLRRITG